MRLRPFTAANLRRCASMLPPGFGIDEPLRARLPEIWHTLNRSHLLLGSVTDDTAVPDDPVSAFGMSVCLAPAFVDDCLSRAEPYMAMAVYRAIEARHSPVLSVRDIARANAGDGLHVLVLHYWQDDLDPAHPRGQALMAAGHMAFRLAHEGFRINRVLWEAYTPQQVALLGAGGFVEKQRYGSAGTDGPWLMGIERGDEASQLLGSTGAFLFRNAAPRFGFSLTEQRLLHGCLVGSSDADATVARSPNTIKKLWQSIYARVEAVNPEVLSPGGTPGDHDSQTRGPEKRRHLLDYLRFHLEELRPHARPPAQRRRRGTSAGNTGARLA